MLRNRRYFLCGDHNRVHLPCACECKYVCIGLYIAARVSLFDCVSHCGMN